MSVQDYSTTPITNATISGINIAEGCPAGNMNAAIRQMMADVKVFYDDRVDPANYVPKTGGAFTGPIRLTGRGGYVHNAASTDLGGAFYKIPFGGELPSGLVAGDFVLELEA
jgi:hypothetical protein